MTDEVTDVTATESSAVDTDVTATGSSAVDTAGDTVDSPSADGAKEPSLVDIIDKALGSGESPTSDESGDAESKDAESQEELPEEVTDEELAETKPKARARIEGLIQRRDELQGKVSELEPKAQQWDRVSTFMAEQNLKPEHVSNTLHIAAMIQNDPQRALEVVGRIYSALSEKAGTVLSPELADAVKSGEITRDRAVELSKAQAQSRMLSEQRDSEAQRRQAADESAKQQTQVKSLSEASSTWDKEQAARDPDWQEKRQEIANRVELRLMRDGMPSTAKEMRDILEAEKAAVEGFIGKFKKPDRKIDPSPTGGSTRIAPPEKPKSHLDALEIGLSR